MDGPEFELRQGILSEQYIWSIYLTLHHIKWTNSNPPKQALIQHTKIYHHKGYTLYLYTTYNILDTTTEHSNVMVEMCSIVLRHERKPRIYQWRLLQIYKKWKETPLKRKKILSLTNNNTLSKLFLPFGTIPVSTKIRQKLWSNIEPIVLNFDKGLKSFKLPYLNFKDFVLLRVSKWGPPNC